MNVHSSIAHNKSQNAETIQMWISWRVNKNCGVSIQWNYLAIKRNEVVIHATPWVNLRSEVSGGLPKRLSYSLFLEPVNVTLFGKRAFADIIQLWIFQWREHPLCKWALNPMTRDKCPYKRTAEGDLKDRRGKDTDACRRGWYKAWDGDWVMWPQAKNAQECWRPPEAVRAKARFSHRASRGSAALPTPRSGTLTSRTVRRQSSVVWSYRVGSHLLRQP